LIVIEADFDGKSPVSWRNILLPSVEGEVRATRLEIDSGGINGLAGDKLPHAASMQ
jgi:hypothetical protein